MDTGIPRYFDLFLTRGTITSRVAQGKAEQASKYRDYHEWEEPIAAVEGWPSPTGMSRGKATVPMREFQSGKGAR